MKQFIKNPTIDKYTNISSIEGKIRTTKYSTKCTQLSDFINDFNKQNSLVKMSVMDKNVSGISSHYDEENKKMNYVLFNYKPVGV